MRSHLYRFVFITFIAATLTAGAITALGSVFVPSATTHIIKCSGKKYSPSSMAVQVGDVVTWECDFSEHPLTLTSAPKGAATFAHIEKGSSYSYTVTVAGDYNYECDMHADEGMVGSFTAK